MNGLFGNIDASEVPDDPFYVAPGTYTCILTEIGIRQTNSGGSGLSIKWVIQDEDSDYFNNSVGDWFNIYPDVAQGDMDANQKRSQSNLKRRLLDLGVSEDQMNTIHEDLDSLVGIEADVTVVERKGKGENADVTYTNITKVVRI